MTKNLMKETQADYEIELGCDSATKETQGNDRVMGDLLKIY